MQFRAFCNDFDVLSGYFDSAVQYVVRVSRALHIVVGRSLLVEFVNDEEVIIDND